MSSTSPRSPRARPRWWPWHQRLGVGFSVIIVIVVLTGITLNHTDGLDLDRITIKSDAVLDWYGLVPEGEPVAFGIDPVVAGWGGKIYLEGQSVGQADALRGAVAVDEQVVLLTGDALWLLTRQGEVIERFAAMDLPDGDLLRLGLCHEPPFIMLETSTGRYVTDADLLSWDRFQLAQDVAWSEAVALSPEQRETVLQAYRGEGLSLYRVILDIHSGRFFGTVGVWVVDAAAVAMLFLTLTGVWYALVVKQRK